MKIYIEVPAGIAWHQVAQRMLDIAKKTEEEVYSIFSDVQLVARPDDTLGDLAVQYECGRKEWIRDGSPAHQRVV